MSYNPQIHHRRSIRLKGYDYSQAGAYYFTIVVQYRACLFGNVLSGEIILNDAGKMVWEQWNTLPERFPNIELDEFIVMPNHVHGILVITERRGDGLSSPSDMGQAHAGQAQGVAPTNQVPRGADTKHDPKLGNILGAWKSIVTDEYIKGVRQKNWEPFDKKLFQRNYYEHIIRNERELDAVRAYIINNPANWENDQENSRGVGRRGNS